MMFKKISAITAAACAGFIFMTGLALAAPAQSTTSLNVRSGPGVGYRVVDVLFTGEHVDVETCRTSGWCFISHRGRDGWVSARYLSGLHFYRERRIVKPRRHAPPKSYRRGPNIQFNFYGPNYFLSLGDGRQRHRDCYRRYGRMICR